jgi:regulator of sigma E protease
MAVTVNWQFLLVILEVAFGLGMVIFVHELGHFAVAKWCGVKVEKFFLGFDIYGLKLASFRWGETQYGIGILPLGGYVKMLGQDDNPGRAAAERERSQLRTEHGELTPVTSADTLGSEGERYELDPRSYMAKSVPQRMAIISAGVIMNVIFAFVMATAAYLMGVKDLACGVSEAFPGEAAWKADMRPGDTIIQIDNSGDRTLRFRDLTNAVALADMQRGIDFLVKREGVAEPFTINVKPDLDVRRLRPTIGVINPVVTNLADAQPVVADTPAAKVHAFKAGDHIVAIDGHEVAEYADYDALLARSPDKTLRFTVARPRDGATKTDSGEAERIEIEVPPRPMRTLGLVMKMGKITAVQADSPAANADIHADDFIVSIDGQPPGDPLRLPEELRRRATQSITLTVSRKGAAGQDELLEKRVTLREPLWSEEPKVPGSSVGVPALGIAFKVLNIVHQTQKGSPAADAELRDADQPASVPRLASNDEVVRASFQLPPRATDAAKPPLDRDQEATIGGQIEPVSFSAQEPNWPFFMGQLQWLPPGTKITLELKDGRTTTLEATDESDWYLADRGLRLAPQMVTIKAHNLSEAVSLGGRETVEVVMSVYSFLRRIGSQISPLMLAGPKTIIEAAGGAASRGVADLLIFLTMLSANLAVINFLPIPLLDGGHMVFLVLEGILRRPVSERVVVAFHYLGFVFLISLMIFVLGLDFGLIPRTH